MGVNYYKTDFGIFPVLVGDDFYSAINSLSSGNVRDSRGNTALGTSLLNAVPISGMAGIICSWSGISVDTDVYNNISDFGLVLSIKNLDATSTTVTQEYDLTGYSPKKVKISYFVTGSGAFGFASSLIKELLFYSYNDAIPFGRATKYTASSDNADYIIFNFLYSNSDMTRFGQLELISNPDKTVSMSHSIIRNASDLSFLVDYFNGVEPIAEYTDPFTPGGESDTGGGEGTFDGTSVDVDFASLPTLSAVDTGFITLYNPTVAQLKALSDYMWSGAFDLDSFKKLFADPMQAILGLSIIPGPVPSSGVQAVTVGNIPTGVSMNKASSQYIDIDCGTITVEEFWGAYLDYEPYTKAEIYLPYIGTHQIAVDDIMDKAVHIKYHIDILSGACAAEIKCGGSVLYTFIGSVAVSIPVTGNDWTNVINGVLSIAGSIGSMVATGGASAPIAAGEIASAAVNSLKPSIEKSGAVSGGGGLMAGKVPVLILTRPRQALPASQNEYTGYPAFITRSLGAVSGYTEVHKIRLGGISATDAELDEIENLLKGGVIL